MSNNRLFKPQNAAAWQQKKGQRPLIVDSAPYTSPPKDCVTIKVVDVAINPIDWIMQDRSVFPIEYPAIFGHDIAGEIVEVGSDVDDFRVGQRVIAHANGYSARGSAFGAFQKYAVAPRIAVAELPYSIPTSRGVVLPLGISTASAGLYEKGFLALPFPSLNPKSLDRSILIWGGSSSVGSCAIQLAVASGARVVTTASARNFDYVRKLGAAKVFDYHDEDVEDQVVKALEGTTVLGAYHAVGADGAVQACARIVDRSKGKAIVVSVTGSSGDGIPSSVRVKGISAGSIFSSAVGPEIWRHYLPIALEKGHLVPKPNPEIIGEELKSIQSGLDVQKRGVSAKKIVISNIS